MPHSGNQSPMFLGFDSPYLHSQVHKIIGAKRWNRAYLLQRRLNCLWQDSHVSSWFNSSYFWLLFFFFLIFLLNIFLQIGLSEVVHLSETGWWVRERNRVWKVNWYELRSEFFERVIWVKVEWFWDGKKLCLWWTRERVIGVRIVGPEVVIRN